VNYDRRRRRRTRRIMRSPGFEPGLRAIFAFCMEGQCPRPN
jgi:hypothetical protein